TAISDKLDLYAFLTDEVTMRPEQAAAIHGEYHEILRKYYDNSLENHRYEVLGEIVSHEIGRQYKKDSLTDRLTETGNRYAYERALDRIPTEDGIPKDVELTVFVLDVNGLKHVNDTYGHAAGDAFIKGAAYAISDTIGQHGAYFRTGGDEFAAIWIDAPADPNAVIVELRQKLGEWKDAYGNTLSMAVGYAVSKDHEDCSVKELVRIADEAMYADKRAFYIQSGRDRRAPRS
nr:GGDEF domain-containing protein [Lachnospiraceae bacterium]